MKKSLEFLYGLFDRLFMLIGVCIGSQFPVFMEQYMLHIKGHLEELTYLIKQIEKSAQLTQKTLSQYIDKFLMNTDLDISRHGQFMDEMVHRSNTFHKAWLEWNESSVWLRPFYFIKNLQKTIFESTWNDFQPGLSFNLESLIFSFCGAIVGVFCWRFLQTCAISFFKDSKKNFQNIKGVFIYQI